jgi:hypothetical protein
MQTRHEWYNFFSALAFVLTIALVVVAFAGRAPSSIDVLYIAGAGTLTIGLALLAWRCDVRLRSERQHTQLMAALMALRGQSPAKENTSVIQRLEQLKREQQKRAK